MNTKPLNIRTFEENDIPTIYAAFQKVGWHRRPGMLEEYLLEQSRGERDVLVAYAGAEFAGYVTVRWKSDYPPFAEQGTPEVVDLNVMPQFQRRHIAGALMDKAEELIFGRSAVTGIGVGLFSDYGPAQRMYVLRGYVPDARGVFYRGQQVKRLQELSG